MLKLPQAPDGLAHPSSCGRFSTLWMLRSCLGIKIFLHLMFKQPLIKLCTPIIAINRSILFDNIYIQIYTVYICFSWPQTGCKSFCSNAEAIWHFVPIALSTTALKYDGRRSSVWAPWKTAVPGRHIQESPMPESKNQRSDQFEHDSHHLPETGWWSNHLV